MKLTRTKRIAFALAICTTIVSAPASVQAQCPVIYEEPEFTVAYLPHAVAIADFNGDGHADLAVTSVYYNEISILLNDGVGGYCTANTYAAAGTPYSIAVADFNGDNFPDVAVSSWGQNGLAVRLNDGSGGLQSATIYTAGSASRSIVAGDFTGDGWQDLALASSGGQVTIMENDGSGGWIQQITPLTTGFGSFAHTWALAAGDVNGDNDPDIVATNNLSDQVAIFHADGAGGFDPAILHSVADSRSSSLVIVDLDSNGLDDLVIATEDPDFTVLMNTGTDTNGHATWATPATYDSPEMIIARALAAGDVNDDGIHDIVVVSPGEVGAAVWINDGQGQMSHASDRTVGLGAQGVAIGDLDGDFVADVAVANYNASTVSILYNDPGDAGTFPEHARVTVGQTPLAITTGDFLDNNKLGMAVANYDDGTVTILRNHGYGTFLPTSTPETVGPQPTSIIAADLNPSQDNDDDLAVACYGDDSVRILRSEGDYSFTPLGAQWFPNLGPIAVGAGDLDGDGDLDLGVALADGNSVGLLVNDGNASFTPGGTISTGLTEPSDIVLADFYLPISDPNHGQYADIVMTGRASDSIQILPNPQHAGTSNFTPSWSGPTGTDPGSLSAGELSADGYLDLAIANLSAGSVTVYWYNPQMPGEFWNRQDYPIGDSAATVVIADVNDDGYADLAVSDFQKSVVAVLLNKPSSPGTFGDPIRYDAESPFGLTTADLDCDDDADLATTSMLWDEVGIILNPLYSSSLPCLPSLPGDVDGDGSVGINDFLTLLADWGQCPPPPDQCLADIDGDGTVGILDLLILLSNWGP